MSKLETKTTQQITESAYLCTDEKKEIEKSHMLDDSTIECVPEKERWMKPRKSAPNRVIPSAIKEKNATNFLC